MDAYTPKIPIGITHFIQRANISNIFFKNQDTIISKEIKNQNFFSRVKYFGILLQQ